MFYFQVPGNPRGKQRPKVTRYGTYTPEETKSYEAKVLARFLDAYPGAKPMDGAVNVMITAWFDVPKSYNKARREHIANGFERPAKKPDAVNIAKIILDALNGKALLDDAQVVGLVVTKNYAVFPESSRVEVLIEEADSWKRGSSLHST